MTQSNIIIAKTPTLTLSSKSSGDFTLSAQINEINSVPYYLITNDKTKEKMCLPTELFQAFLATFSDASYLLNQVKQAQSDLLRKVNHPLKRFTDLASSKRDKVDRNDDNPKTICIYSEVINDRGVPILEWVYDLNSLKSPIGNTKIIKVGTNKWTLETPQSPSLPPRSGWKLTLVGIKDEIVLGFAGWDDVTAIDNLIEKMRTPELLYITLALLDPEESVAFHEDRFLFAELMNELNSTEKEDPQVITRKRKPSLATVKDATPKLSFLKRLYLILFPGKK